MCAEYLGTLVKFNDPNTLTELDCAPSFLLYKNILKREKSNRSIPTTEQWGLCAVQAFVYTLLAILMTKTMPNLFDGTNRAICI